MSTVIEATAPNRLALANLSPRGRVESSPIDWRDQLMYFLLPDRFSDGGEVGRPLFDPSQPDLHRAVDLPSWQRAGKDFQGGNIKGIESKLDYLQSLGVSALWIGPVFRQRQDLDTYHGYGIQHFLDIDPRFGSRQDLRDLVDAAHERGMYVVLDVIYNHSGNNWFYDDNGTARSTMPYRYGPPYPVHSWRSVTGEEAATIGEEADGVWPQEFQALDWYHRAGMIGKWDHENWEEPLHPENEFRRGDFFDLKDFNLQKEEVLAAVIKVYQYWISLSDCDGFRIDTVKHVSFEASRNFCGAIHEYCESIGKSNFLLLGEVTGGEDMAKKYLEIFGRNLDAVLDIGAPAVRLSGMVKGLAPAEEFFNQFKGHDILGTHRETGRYHISILDDHDMVGREKHRFAAQSAIANIHEQTAHAVGVQLTTLGIPCLYYGTEQAFDGSKDNLDPNIDEGFEDRFIRESMFGGSFGAFQTQGCHFFDKTHPAYLRIAAIAGIRNRKDLIGFTLRRGRQYLRETSFLDRPFAYPGPGELIAWSRILVGQEVSVVLNTHGTESRGADVVIDAVLQAEVNFLRFYYRSDWSNQELNAPPTDQTVNIRRLGEYTVVRIDLPPAGMAILG
jgi:glycosidase